MLKSESRSKLGRLDKFLSKARARPELDNFRLDPPLGISNYRLYLPKFHDYNFIL
jgi:hypothetical protein